MASLSHQSFFVRTYIFTRFGLELTKSLLWLFFSPLLLGSLLYLMLLVMFISQDSHQLTLSWDSTAQQNQLFDQAQQKIKQRIQFWEEVHNKQPNLTTQDILQRLNNDLKTDND